MALSSAIRLVRSHATSFTPAGALPSLHAVLAAAASPAPASGLTEPVLDATLRGVVPGTCDGAGDGTISPVPWQGVAYSTPA